MAITYKTVFDLKVPILHRVVYAKTEVDYIAATYQYSLLDHQVDAWLKENCRHAYYHSPGYMREKFIEFEDDEDAVLFALRWS